MTQDHRRTQPVGSGPVDSQRRPLIGPRWDWTAIAISLGVSAAIIVLWAFQLSIFSFLNNKWLDCMFLVRGMEPGDPRISVIAIDDETLMRYPDFDPAALAVFLRANGVAVVGFDVMFLSPPSASRIRKDLIETTAKMDAKMVHALIDDPGDRSRFVFMKPFSALARVTRSFGAANVPFLDHDGVLRKHCLMIGQSKLRSESWAVDSTRVPTLALKMASVYQGKPEDAYLTRGNIFFINYRGRKRVERVREQHGIARSGESHGIRRISAWRVIEGAITKQESVALSGGIAIVGYTSSITGDLISTPFDPGMPGAVIIAETLDGILNDRSIHRVTPLATLLLIALFASAGAFLIRTGPALSVCGLVLILAAWGIVNYLVFLRCALLEFSQPAIALAGCFTVLFIRRTRQEVASKRFIKRTFGRFVAPDVVEELIRNPQAVRQGGVRREMTVLFLDIEHFTSISETMEPDALLNFLNVYLAALSSNIHKRQGVIDKYIGDCIMAFWNAPLEQRDHAARACLAALDCLDTLEDLNRREGGFGGLAVRIGINSGPMVVGFTGSDEKLQYTVIGDEVNLASRLEGVNKFFGSRIIAGEFCFNAARHAVEGRELGCVRVVGKAAPVRVYEVLSRKGGLHPAWQKGLPMYHEALEHVRAGRLPQAEKGFNAFCQVMVGDPAARQYIRHLEETIVSGGIWDGVFNLTTK